MPDNPATRYLRATPSDAVYGSSCKFSNRLLFIVCFACALSLMAACASTDPKEYRQQSPRLELDKYFNGHLKAWGMFQDRSGKVVRRFTVDMLGTWQNNRGTLEEDFTYSDGSKERRVWKITKDTDGQYTGTADDVIGTAQGRAAGNALNWRYTLALPVDGTVYQVNLDDWMYQIDETVLMNRAVMSKFGVRLGEVFITFKRQTR